MVVTQRKLAYLFSSAKMGVQLHGCVFEQNVNGKATQRPLQMASHRLKVSIKLTKLRANDICRNAKEKCFYAKKIKKESGNEIAIAFTYWRRGNLVNCKYRDIAKTSRQEKDTEKIFYGLDDIEDASDIIIVEGEMGKLDDALLQEQALAAAILFRQHQQQNGEVSLPFDRSSSLRREGDLGGA